MTSGAMNPTDPSLWQLACGDDRQAFEELVRRHQSVVSAVAYNVCGDLSLSEDIAQETFWAAWRERATLLDPTRLKSWLCGIARNLAHNARRRGTKAASSLEAIDEPSATAVEPADELVSREEEALVWQALEQIPETYREPLILFYREDHSVAEVAKALDVSSDAVKQRLSRGRDMLREQVAELVEGALRRSRPRAGFTVAVMAGLTAMSSGAKAALAGTSGAAALTAGVGAGGAAALKAAPGAALPLGAAGATAAAGIAGGLAGSAVGLAGGWFGTWLPAQLAPTNRERLFILRQGKRMLIVSIVASLALLLASFTLVKAVSTLQLVLVIVGWIVALQTYLAVECLMMARGVKRIRSETPPESDPNDSPVKAYFTQQVASQWEGRVYRSPGKLLGLPLIDINVGGPSPSGMPQPPKKARGWIAIGDRADGVLLAMGGIARGFFAFGGVSIGVVSAGGLALGLFAMGGLAVGVLALGGLGVGGIACGGGAIGWQALGGGALAWDVACGGGAVAYHAAYGGGALAHDIALGGGASAIHANNDIAKAFFENHWMVNGMKWMQNNNGWVTPVWIAILVLPSLLMTPLMYRRRRTDTTTT